MINHGLDVLISAITNTERLGILMESTSDIFKDSKNQYVFGVMKRLWDDEIPVTIHSVLEVVEQENRADIHDYLIHGMTTSMVVIDFENVIRRLENKAKERRIKLLAKDLSTTTKTEDEIEKLICNITQISEDKKTVDVIPFTEMTSKSLDEAFPKMTFIRTGIIEIDEMMVGMFSTQLIIIAARPRLGKTSLAVQIATSVPVPALFVSMEMNRHEIYGRMLSGRADVESWRIEAHKILPEDVGRVIDAREYFKDRFSRIPFYFSDGLGDKSKILSAMRRHVKQKNVGVIFIDYLQLIGGGEGNTKNDQVGDITRSLKLFAQKYNVPIVLLSQLNRGSERADRPPVLSDLRDSGAIEQDADVVIFIHEKDGRTSLIQAKNRKVGSKEIDINFEKKYTRFGTVGKELVNSMDYIHD